MAYPDTTAPAGEGTILSDAAGYVREQWARFLALDTEILNLQHRAAVAALQARERGDTVSEKAARAMIETLAQLKTLHHEAVTRWDYLTDYVGLGAIAVPVAVATAFSALALVIAWFFRKMALQSELLAQLEAGNLTERAFLEANRQVGEAPDPLRAGMDLGRLALWAFLAWMALQALGVTRTFKGNPPLTVFKANPPGTMSERTWFLAYRHAEDGEDYIHDFGPGVRMEAQEDGSVLLSHPIRPIWRDFA